MELSINAGEAITVNIKDLGVGVSVSLLDNKLTVEIVGDHANYVSFEDPLLFDEDVTRILDPKKFFQHFNADYFGCPLSADQYKAFLYNKERREYIGKFPEEQWSYPIARHLMDAQGFASVNEAKYARFMLLKHTAMPVGFEVYTEQQYAIKCGSFWWSRDKEFVDNSVANVNQVGRAHSREQMEDLAKFLERSGRACEVVAFPQAWFR